MAELSSHRATLLTVHGAGIPECNGEYWESGTLTCSKPTYVKDWDPQTKTGFRIVYSDQSKRWLLGDMKVKYYCTLGDDDSPNGLDWYVAASDFAPGPKVSWSRLQDIQEVMTSLRALMIDEELADVRLELDDGSLVTANRVVLAARSPYFRTLFFGGMREATTNEVEPVKLSGGLQKPVLLAMREWAYTGGIHEYLSALEQQAAAPKVAESDVEPQLQMPDMVPRSAFGGFGAAPPAPRPAFGGFGAAPAPAFGEEVPAFGAPRPPAFGAPRPPAAPAPVVAPAPAPESAAPKSTAVVDGLMQLLQAADQYQMGPLLAVCEVELTRRLTAANVAALLNVADTHGVARLRTCCIDFVISHRVNLPVHALATLPKELLIEIIKAMPQ